MDALTNFLFSICYKLRLLCSALQRADALYITLCMHACIIIIIIGQIMINGTVHPYCARSVQQLTLTLLVTSKCWRH